MTFKKAIEAGCDPSSVYKRLTKMSKSAGNVLSLTISQNINSSPKSIKRSTATQYTGKTKAGRRCKHTTKNSNGRCYQH